ncbi:MAG: ABC transporter substrate-binding protein [Firmicutes bacterium]|nr:ABC transporter substrate-binding protein [Bacillota bacterium]
MKKFLAAVMSMILCLSLAAGCGTETGSSAPAPAAPAQTAEPAAEPASYRVAIVQQLDHASLDEIRFAIEAEIDKRAAAEGVTITYEEFSGQNDGSVLTQIGTQVVSDKYDAVIPIATLAAQIMASSTEDTDIPVIFAAISNPEDAGLAGLGNVTGTSDMLNTEAMMEMLFMAKPDAKTVGLLYSKSEVNSATPIAQAKAYLDKAGVKYVEATGNTTDEILAAASSLAADCDAVFTPTDNVVMAAAAPVAEILNEAGVPHFAGADSFVAQGAFATCGVNYTNLGTYTGDMCVDILLGGAVGDYHIMDGDIITVNIDVAGQLGIDSGIYDSLGKTVVEVTAE